MGAGPPSRLSRYSFLVDRALGLRVALALRDHGFNIVMFGEYFAEGTPDEEWIRRAAHEGWVVLTKDSEIRRRPNERLAIQNSRLRVFTLARGTWKSEEMSAAFIAAERRIAKALKLHGGPFVARILRSGAFSKFDDLSGHEDD